MKWKFVFGEINRNKYKINMERNVFNNIKCIFINKVIFMINLI